MRMPFGSPAMSLGKLVMILVALFLLWYVTFFSLNHVSGKIFPSDDLRAKAVSNTLSLLGNGTSVINNDLVSISAGQSAYRVFAVHNLMDSPKEFRLVVCHAQTGACMPGARFPAKLPVISYDADTPLVVDKQAFVIDINGSNTFGLSTFEVYAEYDADDGPGRDWQVYYPKQVLTIGVT